MSLMAIFCLMTASAQKTVASQQSNKVYDVVDEMPEFPGGQLECFTNMRVRLLRKLFDQSGGAKDFDNAIKTYV